jgi:glycosyltransferase involved in cell wall biosynthesis
VPSLRRSGAETQAVNLVNGLDADRFEPHLLYYEREDSLLSGIDVSKVHVHALRKRRSLDPALMAAIARIIDRHRIELVHCTLQYSLFLAWFARALARRKPPLLCSLHTTLNVDSKFELADRLIFRRMLRSCAALVFVCRNQRDHWARKFPELEPKAHVVYNGVDEHAFDPARFSDRAPLRAALGIPADAKLVTCLAAFRPEKGHLLLLRAFAGVVAEHPNARLVLAGDGATRPAAERLAAHLGLEETVRFAGAQSDVKPLLAASDVTVLASTSVETFSMAMLESMAMGVPVVATDIGGTNEAVLDGETGFLVGPNDVPSLSRAMIRLLSDDALRARCGARARELIASRYTEARMIAETERVLLALGGSASAGLAA